MKSTQDNNSSSSTEVVKPNNSTQDNKCNKHRCKCYMCQKKQYCNTGCTSCSINNQVCAVKYCGDYTLSIQRAKDVAKQTYIEDMVQASVQFQKANDLIHEDMYNLCV